jgi:hypothetical protein
MIQMEVEVCSIDHYPRTTSKAYKDLQKFDPIAAEESIYIILVPDDSA